VFDKHKPQLAIDPLVLAKTYRRDAKTRRERASKVTGQAAYELVKSAMTMEEKADRLTGKKVS
jgi:hypothetical protein